MRRRPLLGTLPALALASRASAAQPAAARKVLRVAFPSPETTLDPVQTNSDSNTVLLLSQILDSPLSYDYLARPAQLRPATTVALPQISADGRVFTLDIRPGIFFADDPAFGGKRRELTAQDYVYSIKRFFDPRWNSSDLYLFETLKLPGMAELRERAVKQKKPFDYDTEVEGLRALSRYRLRITLGVPDPRFVYLLCDKASCGAVAREVVERYGDDIGAHPVGTGPFMLKSWRRRSRIELTRSPSFRGYSYDGTPADHPIAQTIASHLKGRALPLVDEVVVDIVEESQPRWLSFLQGGYDWLLVPGPFRQLAAPGGRIAPYLAKRGIRLQAQVQPDMAMSFFFMQHPLVGGYTADKVALRRAIGLAFDNDAFRRDVHGGFGVFAQSTIPPGTSGFDADYRSEMSEFSPARARALLDLHGYVDRDGDGWREQPDGKPLTLIRSCTSSQLERRANEVWKRSMTAVGLKIEFDISTWPELLKKSRAGTLMIWGYAWAASTPDGGFFLAIAYGPNAGESNDPRFELAAFDRVFERQRTLPDGPEREALMRQAKNLLVAYLPFKVHLHTVALDLVQPWTRGYWRHPFARDLWQYVDVGDPPAA